MGEWTGMCEARSKWPRGRTCRVEGKKFVRSQGLWTSFCSQQRIEPDIPSGPEALQLGGRTGTGPRSPLQCCRPAKAPIWLTIEVSTQRFVIYQLQVLPDPLVIVRGSSKVYQSQDFTAALNMARNINKGLNHDSSGKPGFESKLCVAVDSIC